MLLVVGTCGLVLVYSWNIAQFSMMGLWLGSKPVHADWSSLPGVAFAAREAALLDATGRDERTSCQRNDELAQILAARPLATDYWLSLAKCRFILGENSNKAVEAWRLSVLTGGNQSYIIVRRASFAVSHWD